MGNRALRSAGKYTVVRVAARRGAGSGVASTRWSNRAQRWAAAVTLRFGEQASSNIVAVRDVRDICLVRIWGRDRARALRGGRGHRSSRRCRERRYPVPHHRRAGALFRGTPVAGRTVWQRCRRGSVGNVLAGMIVENLVAADAILRAAEAAGVGAVVGL